MKTRISIIAGIIVAILVSLLTVDQYYLSLQDQEIKKSDWVQNCVPPVSNQVVPSIGLYNHTHSFDLMTCIALDKMFRTLCVYSVEQNI